MKSLRLSDDEIRDALLNVLLSRWNRLTHMGAAAAANELLPTVRRLLAEDRRRLLVSMREQFWQAVTPPERAEPDKC